MWFWPFVECWLDHFRLRCVCFLGLCSRSRYLSKTHCKPHRLSKCCQKCIEYRNTSETTSTMVPHCVGEQVELAAFNEPPKFLASRPVLPTGSCGSVGRSHTRRAKVASRSTPWLDLTGSQPCPWFCVGLTSLRVGSSRGHTDVSDLLIRNLHSL